MTNRGLSEKSRLVLSLIAEGRGYDHIVNVETDISYFDIFRAAEEALCVDGAPAKPETSSGNSGDVRKSRAANDFVARAREAFPNAYVPWTKADEAQLTAMRAAGAKVVVMAEHFQRQPGAIRARLRKLGIEVAEDL